MEFMRMPKACSPLAGEESVHLKSPRLRVLFLVISAWLTPLPAAAQVEYSCSEVLGFSQSFQWYTGGSLPDAGDAALSVKLGVNEFLENWQGRFTFGAAVDRWQAPEYRGWNGAYVSPDPCPRDEVERVVFNVSGPARSLEQWVSAIDSVVSLIRVKYPVVEDVVLLPVVGGPEAECEGVRAARIHPIVSRAIAVVADNHQRVTKGPDPKVATCDQFADQMGHLTETGAGHIRDQLRAHFDEGSAGR